MSDQTTEWVKDYPEALVDFSERYDQEIKTADGKTPLLSIFATGGGMSLSSIAEVPGSSSRLALSFHPYNQKDTIDFLNNAGIASGMEKNWKFCSPQSAISYMQSLMHMCGHRPYFYVAVTAALTTTRWRRGDNRAFISIERKIKGTEVELWTIALSKRSKAAYEAMFIKDDGSIDLQSLTIERRIEDNKISRAVLALILNDPSFANLNEDEWIARVNLVNGEYKTAHDPWLRGDG